MRRKFSNTFYEHLPYQWINYKFIGIILIFLGILIILVPEILIAFIASLFFLAGVSFLFLAWKFRKLKFDKYEI